MPLGIVARQGAVQIHADPVVRSDEDRFGAGVKDNPSAGIA
jgi:hypothetical protein